MRDANDIALVLIKAYNSRADAASAAVVAGVTGLFRWDGECYEISGSEPFVTKVDVGELGEPKRYEVKA